MGMYDLDWYWEENGRLGVQRSSKRPDHSGGVFTVALIACNFA
ncbi:hypothetical protein [Pseudomonas sp. CC6-YY-74]|nr:hypothetical protein [Pseudomonas sp. CC6-YY-74]